MSSQARTLPLASPSIVTALFLLSYLRVAPLLLSSRLLRVSPGVELSPPRPFFFSFFFLFLSRALFVLAGRAQRGCERVRMMCEQNDMYAGALRERGEMPEGKREKGTKTPRIPKSAVSPCSPCPFLPTWHASCATVCLSFLPTPGRVPVLPLR